jgi:flagellar motor protein MotB
MDFDPDLPPGAQFMRLYDLILKAVKHFVDVDKINSQRLSAVGCGESWPQAANSSPANRAKNRRVEILLAVEG